MNKKLHYRLVFPIVLMISAIALVGLSSFYFFQANIVKSDVLEQIDNKLLDVVDQIKQDEMSISELKKDLNEQFITKAKAVAFAIKSNPTLIENKEELDALASLLDVEEIHIVDENGILKWGTVPDFYGFDFATSEQTKPFLKGLNDPEFAMAQEPQERGADKVLFQYVTVGRRDQGGLVQVGLQPERLNKALQTSQIKNIAENLAFLEDQSYLLILNQKENKVLSDSSGTWLDTPSQDLVFLNTLSDAEDSFEIQILGASYWGKKTLYNDYLILGMLHKKNALKQASATVLLTAFFALGVLIFSTLMIWVISNSIKKPIEMMVGVSNAMSHGDFTQKLPIDRQDEIGALAIAFNRMTDAIKSAFYQIRKVSLELENYSSENFHLSTALSENTETQSDAVDKLTQHVSLLTDEALSNAKLSEKAKKLSHSSKDEIENGNEEMGKMLCAMDEITLASNNIYKIIKTIDEIAFQTNLLALNAAVEAARAGAHGKGFTVVAEEVQNLAARSAKAAKETSLLIEHSLSKVNNGTSIAKTTASSLERVLTLVKETEDNIDALLTSSYKQQEDLKAIMQESMIIKHGINATHETATTLGHASEKLKDQAELLDTEISSFHID